jgi:hypothetical protein
MWKLLSFHFPPLLEKVHPLEGGLFRRKRRRDRRPGLPRESRLVFYPREGWNIVAKHLRFAVMFWRYRSILKRVMADDTPYSDIATTPVQLEDVDTLQLYTDTRGSREVVDKFRRKKLRATEPAAASVPDDAQSVAVSRPAVPV